MTNHEQAIKKAKFADMKFQVGQRVQLILESAGAHKQYTSVIGWVENEFLMRYQIQEMLRVEKTFEDEGIQDELDAYNPMVPGGSDFKVTMMIEYPNEADRRVALAKLVGVEDQIFIEIEGQPRVYAIADEDLERATTEKTSAVHFLRIPLTPAMKEALKAGAQMMVGCDHKGYPMHVETLPHETLASLVTDLD